MEQLTQSEKINLSTTEIAKRIRTQLKEIKGCKFSVVSEYYSMGSSITISLMEFNFKVIKDFSELSEKAIFDYGTNSGRTQQQLKEMQESDYCQLNPCATREDYNPDIWNNGVFLTKEGFDLIKKITEIVNTYNYDNSDSMTDYYDVNFAFYLQIGKWNKPFKQVVLGGG